MSKLTILRGVSGSGKSTWAAQQNALVVSRDNLRAAFFPNFTDTEYYKSPILRDMEDSITRIQDAAIETNLRLGKDVIVDNTNVEWRYVKALAKIANKVGAEVEIKVFDVPLQRAINNNTWRAANGGRNVPRDVIEKQHSRLQGTKDKTLDPVFVPAPYEGTPGKPKAVLVDVDGTLMHMNGKRGPFEWHKVHLDDHDEVICQLAYDLHGRGYKIVIMSGRDESCRDLTAKSLDAAAVWVDEMFMRPEKDMRPDNIVKAELFDKYVRDNFDVKFVLDDRNQVVDMWRAMGLTCLQVAPGDF